MATTENIEEPKVETPEPEAVETTEKKDEDKTIEELKAEAEALEKELKTLKEQKGEDEVKQNQLRRLQKAREKKEELSNSSQPEEKRQKADDVDVRDLLTLSKQEIPEDSDKAAVLKRYKDAGLIKSYAEGLESVAVKAEFDAIDARNNAKAIIDENSDEETRLKSTKEVIKQYQTSGEIPQDPKLQAALARENLKTMGF